jgi:hypothetical protein
MTTCRVCRNMRTTGFVLALLILPAMATAQQERPVKGTAQQTRSSKPDGPPAKEQARPAGEQARPAKEQTRPDKDHSRPAERPRHPLDQPRQLPGSLGPIGLPLPSIGLPLPSIGIQPVPGQNRRPDHPIYAPGRYRRSRSSVVYVVPSYGWSGYASPAPPPPAESGVTVFTPEPEVGQLRLDVQPADRWQLFVDGAFVGTQEDLGSDIDIQAGPRRIELRAPGYQPLAFDTRIEVGRSITYRGRLEPIQQSALPDPPARRETPIAAPPPVAPAGSRTLYVIPGCYLGNVMPQKEKLREGCDMSTMKTFTP